MMESSAVSSSPESPAVLATTQTITSGPSQSAPVNWLSLDTTDPEQPVSKIRIDSAGITVVKPDTHMSLSHQAQPSHSQQLLINTLTDMQVHTGQQNLEIQLLRGELGRRNTELSEMLGLYSHSEQEKQLLRQELTNSEERRVNSAAEAEFRTKQEYSVFKAELAGKEARIQSLLTETRSAQEECDGLKRSLADKEEQIQNLLAATQATQQEYTAQIQHLLSQEKWLTKKLEWFESLELTMYDDLTRQLGASRVKQQHEFLLRTRTEREVRFLEQQLAVLQGGAIDQRPEPLSPDQILSPFLESELPRSLARSKSAESSSCCGNCGSMGPDPDNFQTGDKDSGLPEPAPETGIRSKRSLEDDIRGKSPLSGSEKRSAPSPKRARKTRQTVVSTPEIPFHTGESARSAFIQAIAQVKTKGSLDSVELYVEQGKIPETRYLIRLWLSKRQLGSARQQRTAAKILNDLNIPLFDETGSMVPERIWSKNTVTDFLRCLPIMPIVLHFPTTELLRAKDLVKTDPGAAARIIDQYICHQQKFSFSGSRLVKNTANHLADLNMPVVIDGKECTDLKWNQEIVGNRLSSLDVDIYEPLISAEPLMAMNRICEMLGHEEPGRIGEELRNTYHRYQSDSCFLSDVSRCPHKVPVIIEGRYYPDLIWSQLCINAAFTYDKKDPADADIRPWHIKFTSQYNPEKAARYLKAYLSNVKGEANTVAMHLNRQFVPIILQPGLEHQDSTWTTKLVRYAKDQLPDGEFRLILPLPTIRSLFPADKTMAIQSLALYLKFHSNVPNKELKTMLNNEEIPVYLSGECRIGEKWSKKFIDKFKYENRKQ